MTNSQERDESQEQCHGALIASREKGEPSEGDDRDKWILIDFSIRRPLKTGAELMVEGTQLFRVGNSR